MYIYKNELLGNRSVATDTYAFLSGYICPSWCYVPHDQGMPKSWWKLRRSHEIKAFNSTRTNILGRARARSLGHTKKRGRKEDPALGSEVLWKRTKLNRVVPCPTSQHRAMGRANRSTPSRLCPCRPPGPSLTPLLFGEEFRAARRSLIPEEAAAISGAPRYQLSSHSLNIPLWNIAEIHTPCARVHPLTYLLRS